MIYQKLLSIQKIGLGVQKKGINPHFKSSYMLLDDIMEIYNPVLSEKGLLIFHKVISDVLLTFVCDTEDESFVLSEFRILNTDPQKRGAEITYGKRYNLGCLLNIITEQDDDGNKASGVEVKKVKETVYNISGKGEVIEKKWFNKEDFDLFCQNHKEGQINQEIQDIKNKYKISKEMQEKINKFYELTNSKEKLIKTVRDSKYSDLKI